MSVSDTAIIGTGAGKIILLIGHAAVIFQFVKRLFHNDILLANV